MGNVLFVLKTSSGVCRMGYFRNCGMAEDYLIRFVKGDEKFSIDAYDSYAQYRSIKYIVCDERDVNCVVDVFVSSDFYEAVKEFRVAVELDEAYGLWEEFEGEHGYVERIKVL